MKLSPTEIFKGKKIFFIGGTGLVRKVNLLMLPPGEQIMNLTDYRQRISLERCAD